MRGEARGPVANRRAITASIMLATIMQGVDNTIANVALPHIQGSLSAAQDQIAWVLTSYIVAAAITMPLTGWLAGRFGIKYIFLMSVGGFTLASALCGSATSLGELVFYRLLQGVCGAGLVPLSQSILMQINPPERHGQAIAVWGIGVMLGPIFGPMLGGWLTESYSWRWIFYINLPVGMVAFLGIMIFIREGRHAHREAFDFFGFATLSVAVGALQMMLDRGEIKDWFGSTEIWVEAAVAGVAGYLFVVHTATAGERSFLNRDLLKNINFAVGTILMFLIGGILSGTLALVPTMLQSLMDYPVFTTGLVTAPRGVGTMAAMFLVGRLINRVDNRLIILSGLLMTVVSLWQMTGFSLQMGMAPVITSGLLQGFRIGLHLCPDEHHGVVEPAAAHPDPGDGVAQPDAQSRRQHRHFGVRGVADAEHANRAFAIDRASAARQPARARAVSVGAVQLDQPLRHRRAQCRGHPAGRDGCLYRRLHLHDGDRRGDHSAASVGPPAATHSRRAGRGRLRQSAGWPSRLISKPAKLSKSRLPAARSKQ